MPTKLEELFEFLHHGNTQVRQIACENLVGYSSSPAIFKTQQLLPVRDLKLLVRDYPPIAKNALTILINLSTDQEVLVNLAEDSDFLETLLRKITNPKDPDPELLTSLLSNLAKHASLSRLVTLKRPIPPSKISSSPSAIDQLMDCFTYTSSAAKPPLASSTSDSYAYISYVLSTLSALHESMRSYFLTVQSYDKVLPITKITPFTEHPSLIRRRGVASTVKNCCFDSAYHGMLLDPDQGNILPYILLPLCGDEDLSSPNGLPHGHPETLDDMLTEIQLLPPDKQRDSDPQILITHCETLLLLTKTPASRHTMRRLGVYPVVRECHAAVENEGVREAAERVAQVLLSDERELEGEVDAEGGFVTGGPNTAGTTAAEKVTELREKEDSDDDDDDDDKIVEIF